MHHLQLIEEMKENIQPIKCGRNPSVLLAALDIQKDAILGKQNIFEQQLRTYSGDDPLGLWFVYIRWVEQNFPSGGKSGNLGQILQRCLVALGSKKKYENDPRLCEIWIKFATITTEPLQVYNYMYDNTICSENAQFYTSWAWQLEQVGNINAANKVLVQGLNCKAQPTENLLSAIRQFELRFTKLYHSAPNIPSLEEWFPESNSTFNILKLQGTGQCNLAGSTGEFVTHAEEQLSTIQPHAVYRKYFNINPVEKRDGMLAGRSASEGNIYMLNSSSGKENIPVSTRSKIRSQKANNIMPQATRGTNLSFTFHQDSKTEEYSPVHRKPDKGFNALRLRKNNPSPPVALFEKPDPLKTPMYDKVKVYCGAEEFSFEEIHAAVWFENQKRLKKQELWHQSKCSVSKRLDFSHAHRLNLHCPADMIALDGRNTTQVRGCLRNMISNQDQIYLTEGFPLGDSPSYENSVSTDISHNADFGNMEKELLLQKAFPPFTIYCSPEKEIPSIKKKFMPNGTSSKDNENIPPAGYLPISVPHQRPGVLQPIMLGFEEVENDLSVEETGMQVSKNNITINTPVDTVQFVCSSAISASTPIKYDSCVDVQAEPNDFVGEIPNAKHVEPNQDFSLETAKKLVVSQCSRTPLDCETKEKNTSRSFSGGKISLAQFSKDLSIIFETTREHRSKSTSGTASSGKDSNSTSQLKYEETNSNDVPHRESDLGTKTSCISGFTDEGSNNPMKQCSTAIEKQEPIQISRDPFDPETTKHLLTKIKHPLISWNNFHELSGSVKNIKPGKEIYLRSGHYLVTNFLAAKGADGCLYAAKLLRSFAEGNHNSPEVAIRVSESRDYWEFYICVELHRRLLKSASVDVTKSVMECLCAISYGDGIALVTELWENVTLVDLINLFKICSKPVPECLVMYLAFEILLIVSQIHQCRMLHCDIKPENFVIVKIPAYQEVVDSLWIKTLCLKLVNFRMGVDLIFFEKGATFYTACKDLDFPQHGPWSFNADYYGVANTIYNILFSHGMNVRIVNGRHELVNVIKEKSQRDMWMPLFEMLLNLPLNGEPPDIKPFLNLIAEKLHQQKHNLKFQLLHLSDLYEKQLKW